MIVSLVVLGESTGVSQHSASHLCRRHEQLKNKLKNNDNQRVNDQSKTKYHIVLK